MCSLDPQVGCSILEETHDLIIPVDEQPAAQSGKHVRQHTCMCISMDGPRWVQASIHSGARHQFSINRDAQANHVAWATVDNMGAKLQNTRPCLCNLMHWVLANAGDTCSSSPSGQPQRGAWRLMARFIMPCANTYT